MINKRPRVAGEPDRPTAYMVASARFLWFIIVQTGALVVALVAKGFWFDSTAFFPTFLLRQDWFDFVLKWVTFAGWWLGFFLFI